MRDWFNLTMLAMESQQVIWLRLMTLSSGGTAASSEVQLMLSEKMLAASSATLQLMGGATPDSVVKGYRRKVRANMRRLTKQSGRR